MKIYTDKLDPLTQALIQEAVGLVEQGKRVFYIAPNSLSFEKEAVLSYLKVRLLGYYRHALA